MTKQEELWKLLELLETHITRVKKIVQSEHDKEVAKNRRERDIELDLNL